MLTVTALLLQVTAATAYYAALGAMMRMAGKRLAGQTTTFDLLVLISLSVVLQQIALFKGAANALVFILTVFGAHVLTARACRRKLWITAFILLETKIGSSTSARAHMPKLPQT